VAHHVEDVDVRRGQFDVVFEGLVDPAELAGGLRVRFPDEGLLGEFAVLDALEQPPDVVEALVAIRARPVVDRAVLPIEERRFVDDLEAPLLAGAVPLIASPIFP